MTPYLLVFFLLVGDYPVQTVQPHIVGMYATVESCGMAAPVELEKIQALSPKIENLTGACVSSGIETPTI